MATLEFHPGALVKCPACGGEVPMSQASGDPERPFRCEPCRARGLDLAHTLVRISNSQEGRTSGQKQPNDNLSDSGTSPRTAKSRDRKVKPESPERTMDDNGIHHDGDSGEDRLEHTA